MGGGRSRDGDGVDFADQIAGRRKQRNAKFAGDLFRLLLFESQMPTSVACSGIILYF